MNITRLASRIKRLEIKAGFKFCTGCKTNKPVDEFYKDPRKVDGLQHYCKACKSKRGKAEYKRNPLRRKERSFINKYNLSLDEIEVMRIKQNGLCAVCGKPNNKMVVDHDHATGKVRGLVCPKHNNLLGMADDNIDILKSAISYLESYVIKKES